MPRVLSIAEAQADLDHLVDEAQGEPISLTRGGKVVAVLVASEEVFEETSIRWGTGKPLGLTPPVACEGGLQDLIQEGRG